jgi:hypothetical protein
MLYLDWQMHRRIITILEKLVLLSGRWCEVAEGAAFSFLYEENKYGKVRNVEQCHGAVCLPIASVSTFKEGLRKRECKNLRGKQFSSNFMQKV